MKEKSKRDEMEKCQRELDNQRKIDSFDYLANAASNHDCTGLIPSAPMNDAELESYNVIYQYEPPEVKLGWKSSKNSDCK